MKTISLLTLLREQNVIIPIIQRDYAQGRRGKEFIRKNFLTDIKETINEDRKLELDFVYGTNDNGVFYPLDGQQRITTLWLVYWFFVWKESEESRNYNLKILKNFSYRTRISARNFCEKLCELDYKEVKTGKELREHIENQKWFLKVWLQDPTIQAMLNTLCGYEQDSKENPNVVDIFNDVSQNITALDKVVFYKLDIDSADLPISDDLYIKMNARGKPLTSFENLKADLVGYIRKKFETELYKEQKEKWGNLLDVKEGIPIKLDTAWTDIFWKNRSINGDKVKIDEIYFAFLNRFFWNELFLEPIDNEKVEENPTYKYLNGSEIEETNGSKTSDDTRIVYSDINIYKYKSNHEIPSCFFEKLSTVLDNYKKLKEAYEDEKVKEALNCAWEKADLNFIPQYEKDDKGNLVESTDNNGNKIYKTTTLNQRQRIAFFAVCKFLKELDAKNSKEETYKQLKRWMRVVWNLISGIDGDGKPQIRSVSAVQRAIKFINSLDSQYVYESLKDYDINKLKDSDERVKEEIAKANQILRDDGKLNEYKGSLKKEDGSNYSTWEEIIIYAENYAFFNGSIRFLFRDERGEWNWDDFDTKLTNAQKFFDPNGVRDYSDSEKYKTNAILLKAALYHVRDYEKIEEKFVLDNKASTWHANILLNKDWAYATNNVLMGNLSIGDRCTDSKLYKTLYNSDLLNYIANEQECSRINWNYGHFAIYKRNERKGRIVVLDDDDFHRNEVLSSLLEKGVISSVQKIRNINFFIGWDINFRFNNHNYQWCRTDYIYLTEDDNPDNYIVRDESKSSEDEKFYCFRAKDKKTDDIIKELGILQDNLKK